MTEAKLQLTCACGWRAEGTADEVVAATMEHAKKLHNMETTREVVLERAVPIGAGF